MQDQQSAKTLAKKIASALETQGLVALDQNARQAINWGLNTGLSLAGEFGEGGDVRQMNLAIRSLDQAQKFLPHSQILDAVAQANGFKDWNAMAACAPKDVGQTEKSVLPDFEAVRDKRMSELTPAQQDDARELWLREQLGFMPEYHRAFYEFLLKRLDDARQMVSTMGKAARLGGDPSKLDFKAIALLRNLEWSGTETEERYGDPVPACPICGAEKSFGEHYEGCEMHVLLTRESLPGATAMEIGDVCMTDLYEYETPDQVPAWAWVEENASYAHKDNGQDGVWEFVLNLDPEKHFEHIPAELQPIIAKARADGLGYLVIHQGT